MVAEKVELEPQRGMGVGTGEGCTLSAVNRFPSRDGAHAAVYTKNDGMAAQAGSKLFEDSGGNVWISTSLVHANGLARGNRSAAKTRPTQTRRAS